MTFPDHTPATIPGKASAKITSTPWGKPQCVQVIAHGIYAIETASHGGIYLSPERNAEVPDYFKTASFNRADGSDLRTSRSTSEGLLTFRGERCTKIRKKCFFKVICGKDSFGAERRATRGQNSDPRRD